MASGSPSRRRHSSPTADSAASVGSHGAPADSARWRKSCTAGAICTSTSPLGRPSPPRTSSRSPSRPSGSRLVATTRNGSAPPSNRLTNRATPSRTCSQLSRTRRAGRPAKPTAAASGEATPSWPLTSCTPAPVGRAESSAVTTPPGNRSARERATSVTSRVLPLPPGPVTVTNGASETSSTSWSCSASRPRNVDRGATTPAWHRSGRRRGPIRCVGSRGPPRRRARPAPGPRR